MHMPGHKRSGRFDWLSHLSANIDITEIHGFDDLNDPDGIFLELCRRAAELRGAKMSVPLVNGSTGGILAAVRTGLEKGGELLLARNCHKSVYNAGEMFSEKIRFILPEISKKWGVWGSVTPESVETALDMWPKARLVAVTSPTYEGVISDIAGIAEVCHRYGAALLVDQAHGAHLGYGKFPADAVSRGADMVVESLHKTLPSLTQTAMMYVQGEIVNAGELKRNCAIFQTSSPSYILSASIDGCVRFMEEKGGTAADEWFEVVKCFRDAASNFENLRLIAEDEPEFFSYDISKLAVSCSETVVDGPELMEQLRKEYGVELEMASAKYVLAMTGMGDSEESVRKLYNAFKAVDGHLPPRLGRAEIPQMPALPETRLQAREALSLPGERVEISAAAGRVSKEYLWAYPPGSPVLIPGEVIDNRIIEYIYKVTDCGVRFHSTNSCLPFVECVAGT